MEYAKAAFGKRLSYPDAYCPIELFHVWEWFLAMIRSGMSPLISSEIKSYGELTGSRYEPADIHLLFRLDAEYRVAMATKPDPTRRDVDVDDAQGVRALLVGAQKIKPKAVNDG